MRRQTVALGAGLGCTFALLGILFSSQQPTPQTTARADSQPAASALTPAQQQLLEASGLAIALPTYVPRGFVLEKVITEASRQARVGGVSYALLYRYYDSSTDQDFCFAIEATNGGIGGIPTGEESFAIDSPTFGESTLEYGIYGAAQGPTYISNWLGEETGPFYRFVGADVLPSLSRCENIPAQEAVQVLESLTYQN